jgi:hypothetical protein
MGVPTLFMKYESFVLSPHERLSQILGFARIGFRDEDLNFILSDNRVELGVSHTVEGSRTRFNTGPVELRVDDAWRTKMQPRERRLVTAITWPLLVRYGYPVGGP